MTINAKNWIGFTMRILQSVKILLSRSGLNVRRQQSSKVPRELTHDELTLNCCDTRVTNPKRKTPKDVLRQSFKAMAGPRSRDKQRTGMLTSWRAIRNTIFSSTLIHCRMICSPWEIRQHKNFSLIIIHILGPRDSTSRN